MKKVKNGKNCDSKMSEKTKQEINDSFSELLIIHNIENKKRDGIEQKSREITIELSKAKNEIESRINSEFTNREVKYKELEAELNNAIVKDDKEKIKQIIQTMSDLVP